MEIPETSEMIITTFTPKMQIVTFMTSIEKEDFNEQVSKNLLDNTDIIFCVLRMLYPEIHIVSCTC